MPAVLVHGVPETSAVWAPLQAHLQRPDVVTLALPGFGCPRPAGFGATKEEYVAWLTAELEGMEGPVDLVGHDWGGGLAIRLVATRPELVRSWAIDSASFADLEFEWHAFAKLWQTPEAGEEFFRQVLAAPPAENASMFESFGVPPDQAAAMASWPDETMAGCILALYRSALDVGREWGPGLVDVPTPGLVIVPAADPFLSPDGARVAAGRAGAAVVELAGAGHWWLLADPAPGAAALEEFWASL